MARKWIETAAVIAIVWQESGRAHAALVSGDTTLASTQLEGGVEDHGEVVWQLNGWLRSLGFQVGRRAGRHTEFAKLGHVYAAITFPLERRV